MRIASYHVRALWLCSVLGALGGCSASTEDSQGTLSVNLVGQAPSGAVYRLRQAIITVQGPTSSRTWNTEDDLNGTSLSAAVATGDYSASLQDGWHLERLEGTSTTPVVADLISDNPARFTVEPLQRTSVPLQFRVDTEAVDLSQGYDIAISAQEGVPRLVIANLGDGVLPPSITIHARGASGGTAPIRTIAGPATTLQLPTGVAVAGDEIVVCDLVTNAVDVFPLAASGNVAPIRRIVGSSTAMVNPGALVVSGGEIYVAQDNGAITVFPLGGSGNIAPTRTIAGIGFVDGLAIDHGELYVTARSPAAIKVFPTSASGFATPTRTITSTLLPCPLGIAVHAGEILVTEACNNAILAFAQTASGDVAPLRTIAGNLTGFSGLQQLAAFRDEIFVASASSNNLEVFPARASGDVAPARALGGSGSGLALPVSPFVF